MALIITKLALSISQKCRQNVDAIYLMEVSILNISLEFLMVTMREVLENHQNLQSKKSYIIMYRTFLTFLLGFPIRQGSAKELPLWDIKGQNERDLHTLVYVLLSGEDDALDNLCNKTWLVLA